MRRHVGVLPERRRQRDAGGAPREWAGFLSPGASGGLAPRKRTSVAVTAGRVAASGATGLGGESIRQVALVSADAGGQQVGFDIAFLLVPLNAQRGQRPGHRVLRRIWSSCPRWRRRGGRSSRAPRRWSGRTPGTGRWLCRRRAAGRRWRRATWWPRAARGASGWRRVDDDGADASEPVGAAGKLVAGREHVGRVAALGRRRQALAGVAQREVHGVGEGAVGAGPRPCGRSSSGTRAASWPGAEKITSGFSVTSPVAPSMVGDHVLGPRSGWPTETRPVSGLRVSTIPDLPGTPVITRCSSPGCRRGLIQASGSGGRPRCRRAGAEGMVEVRVLVQVLVVSSGSCRVGATAGVLFWRGLPGPHAPG